MKYFVYLLQSEKDKRFYIGSTSDHEKRLTYHNRGSNKSTRHRRPLKLVHVEEYDEKSDATKREFLLKSPKGFLEKKRIIEDVRNSGEPQTNGFPSGVAEQEKGVSFDENGDVLKENDIPV
ncbi:MAG: GIY-YIG nuclease family protein [Candidatus Moranbacteria bacterium]|nr:GIY-YIG nuclease family protein [Candidatus Moranbacteria bacterium]